jgi:hypothetical protein
VQYEKCQLDAKVLNSTSRRSGSFIEAEGKPFAASSFPAKGELSPGG